MACPNINLDSWKNLVAARGEDVAYYLWDKHDGNVPQEEYTPVKEGVFFQLDKKKLPAAQEKLDNQLLTFLGQFGVTSQEINDFKERFGVDALGATDIMQKLIYLSSKKNISTVPEEAAHMMVILMGKNHPLIKEAFANIENWSGYNAVKKQYMPLYKNEGKVKVEALGQLIRDAIVNKYTSENPVEKSLFERIRELIDNFFKSVRDKFGIKKNSELAYDKQAVMKIAEGMLSGDESLVTSQRSFRYSNNVNYYKALEKDPLAKEIVDEYTEDLPFKLSGSLAVSKQTNIERWKGEEIHDLDFKVPKEWLDVNGEEEFDRLLDKPNIIKLREIRNEYSSYHTKSYLQAPKGYRIEMRGERISSSSPMMDINVYDEKGNKLSVLESLDKVKTLDFFIGGENEETSFENVASWQDVFQGKLSLSPVGESEVMFDRPKDQTDYINVTPVNIQPSRPKNLYLQTEAMPVSKASKETLDKVKEVLKKMGVDVQALTEYAKANPEVDVTSVNGVADLVKGVIAIAEGREDVALTEEMVHIATAILEQTNPKMVTDMIAKIDRFQIYKQTLEAYKNNKAYQLPNGKPDIRKIKKEAVDKLIAELIVNQNDGSTEFPELMQEENRSLIRRWWDAITDWFRGAYKKTNISVFEEAARAIVAGEVTGQVSQIEDGGVFFQVSEAQKKIQDKILETRNSIKKVESEEKNDPMFMDTEEANNWYEKKDNEGVYKRVTKRVTDRVKSWYAARFPGKTFTAEEKKFNELKRNLGVKGHKDFEEIHARFFNADGTRKTKPDPRPTKFNLEDVSMYETLENYYVDLIDSFSKEGQSPLVFSETIIFDDKTNEAGTVDLLIVEPSGKTSIIDWKFMQINGEDIAWFKQGAFNIQLTRYKEILRDNYGVKQFGLNRAIPISMKLGLADRANPKSPTVLKGIAMGSVDTTKIEDLTLVPVSQESESTGYAALDKLLTELNAILKQIQKETVSDEDEREFKIERMNTLKRAMRMAQGTMNMSGLIKVITVMRKEGDNLVNEYKTVYENLPASSTDVNNAQLSDFADNMRNFMEAAAVLGRVDDAIRDLIYNEQWEKDAKTEEEKEALAARKQIAINLSEEARKIRINTTEIENSYKKFADKHIGERNLVTGLLNDEAVVKGFSRLFRGVSDLPTAALQLLTKITGAAKLNASQDAISKVDRLLEIRKKLSDRGGDLRRLVQTIYQKDEKGSIVNKLIYKYSKEFYDAVKEKAIAGGDLKWLRDNVDIESYKKEAFTIMERNINRIKNNNYGETEAEDADTKDRLILQEQRKWDIDRDDFNGFNNYILKRHPQSKWYSEEYKQIMQDEDLLELYNFITSYNSYARDLGYIDNRVASIFLPFVSKSMAESIAWDYGTTAVTNFANDLTINVEDVGYGNINALTGELENSIPKYYTYDFTFENGVNDYSMVSEDLFKNVILYIQQVEKYKYLSEVEGQINLVRTVEKFKNHLTTGKTGDLIIKDGSPVVEKGNEDNAKLFDQFTRALLYGQKYSVSDSDTPLYIGNVINFMKTAVNRVAGKEIFKPNENPSPTSLVKTMDATNRAFALKLLGGDPISGLVNWFGANVQLSAQAGNYFKAREFLKNEGKLVGNRFSNSEERKMFIQMIDLFLPMKEDPNYDKLRQAGMTTLTRMNFSDILMFFMREPEQHVEKTLFLTLLDNTMVENGKIVNIREFVKKKYTGRSRSSEAYKTAKEAIEKEIEELKSTRSISATKQLVDGKLVIPGLDMNNRQEIQRLSNLTRRISRNITGSLSEDDINMMQMSVWTRSMMVFKNWIPKLVDTRFGEFRKVSDDFSVQIDDDGNITGEKYDIGRLRLWFRVIGSSFVDKSSNVLNILNMNDKGVLALDKLYDQMRDEYEKNTGKTMNLSRDDFADMIRDNLRNQIKELSIIAALMAATFALGFAAPDDDEDRAAKNTFRYYAKVLDKFTDELTFFYSPEGIESVLKGSILPAISIFSDIISFTKHMGMEITGYDFDPETSDEKVRENAKPIKKFVRLFPVGKTVLTYMGMFSSEFAKEYDITIQKESSIR